jgi:hypothetical protein
LTRTGGWLLKKAGAETFADRLREEVLKWSRGLPEELSDLDPDAVVKRLFEADCEQLGPKRQCLAKCFEDETIPEEVTWFEAIKIRATRDGFLLRSRLPIIYNRLAVRRPITAV